jgi:predicted amidophosphoribosyltransferase
VNEAPVIKRGKYYFCPECGRLMKRLYTTCPGCQLRFKGEIVEDKLKPPLDPDKMAEVAERYEQLRSLNLFWVGIGVVVFLGALAIVILILSRY